MHIRKVQKSDKYAKSVKYSNLRSRISDSAKGSGDISCYISISL